MELGQSPRVPSGVADVRIRSGPAVDQAARALRASAFTLDGNIYLGAQREGGGDRRRRVLSHEFAHALQQRGAMSLRPEPGQRGDVFERAADGVAAVARASSAVPALQLLDRRDEETPIRTEPAVGPHSDQRAVVGLQRPAPERTEVDVTGRYHAVSGRHTLQLNQAGRHLEGWWQHHSEGIGMAPSIRSYRLVADVVAEAPGVTTFDYERRAEDGTTVVVRGRLEARREEGAVSLTLTEEPLGEPGPTLLGRPTEWRFLQYSAAPRLSAEAIAGVPEAVRPAVEASETAPLDAVEEQRLAATAPEMAQAVARWVETGREGIAPRSAAARLDRLVGERLAAFRGARSVLATRRLREHLQDLGYESGVVTRPMWDWLQIVVSSHPEFTPQIQARLGIQPAGMSGAESSQHRYRWKSVLAGPEGKIIVGLGVKGGLIMIDKLAPDTWSAGYWTVQAAVSGGKSFGLNLGGEQTWNDVETPFPWKKENFVGWYTILESKVSAGPVDWSPGKGSMVVFEGDGQYPRLHGDASGWTFVFGASAGASGGMVRGYLGRDAEDAVAHVERIAPRQGPILAESTHQVTGAVHFGVDQASLNDRGRAAVREMAAIHRAALSNPGSTLSIDGYASTTGPDAHNFGLAYRRAANTRQAIMDVLASVLPADLTVELNAHGEETARARGVPDDVEDPGWRRVDVILNGRTVLSLR